jgi:hypothetical protein
MFADSDQGWNHGKRVYKKVDSSASGGVSVLIYFWDGRYGRKFHGWWFAPKIG